SPHLFQHASHRFRRCHALDRDAQSLVAERRLVYPAGAGRISRRLTGFRQIGLPEIARAPQLRPNERKALRLCQYRRDRVADGCRGEQLGPASAIVEALQPIAGKETEQTVERYLPSLDACTQRRAKLAAVDEDGIQPLLLHAPGETRHNLTVLSVHREMKEAHQGSLPEVAREGARKFARRVPRGRQAKMRREPAGHSRRLVPAARHVAVPLGDSQSLGRGMEIEADVPRPRRESRLGESDPRLTRKSEGFVKIRPANQLAFGIVGLSCEALRDRRNPRPGAPPDQNWITAKGRSVPRGEAPLAAIEHGAMDPFAVRFRPDRQTRAEFRRRHASARARSDWNFRCSVEGSR